MPYDSPNQAPQKIAVIGGGISGLATAYKLSPHHDVTLYEAAPTLGGHARTVMAGRNGDQPVDTGFIVFNYANYPHLTAMFRDLDVPVERSDMSFGATIDNGRVEYGLQTLGALFGQRSNMVNPAFLRMLRDLFRFNDRAEALATDEALSIGDLMDQLGMGRWFRDYYFLPICGAIWSTPPDKIADFPAQALLQFFRNHALLSATGQHQWWTVTGGSIQYVNRLATHLKTAGVMVNTNAPVASVTRSGASAQVHVAGAPAKTFDHVVFACHSDDALRLLDRPTKTEKQALGDITYQDNPVILHRDETLMPRRRACWSSWVYAANTSGNQTAAGVTYWMNRLQNIPQNDPLFISLNPVQPVRDDAIYDSHLFRHPVFDAPALRAQKTIGSIQGDNNTWFTGAYLRYGFHEDGFASAVRVAKGMERQFA